MLLIVTRHWDRENSICTLQCCGLKTSVLIFSLSVFILSLVILVLNISGLFLSFWVSVSSFSVWFLRLLVFVSDVLVLVLNLLTMVFISSVSVVSLWVLVLSPLVSVSRTESWSSVRLSLGFQYLILVSSSLILFCAFVSLDFMISDLISRPPWSSSQVSWSWELGYAFASVSLTLNNLVLWTRLLHNTVALPYDSLCGICWNYWTSEELFTHSRL